MRSEGSGLSRSEFIAALARRAAAQEGALRRVLDERLADLQARHGEAALQTHHALNRPTAPATRTALGALLADIEGRARAVDPSATPVAEALGHARSTWARLSAARRLTQSRDSVPDNAGPLNSNYLLHQALQLMRDVSPEYLHRFTAHVDALLWLGQISSGSVVSSELQRPRRRTPPRAQDREP